MDFLLSLEKERSDIEAKVGSFLSKLELVPVEDYYHKQGRDLAFNLGNVRRYLRLLRDSVLEKDVVSDEDRDSLVDLCMKSHALSSQLDFVIRMCEKNDTDRAIGMILLVRDSKVE